MPAAAVEAGRHPASPWRRARSRFLSRLTAFLSAGGWFDRASILRHFALCLAAVLAYSLRHELQAGPQVLWIIAVTALLNLATYLFAERRRIGAFSRVLSPFLGVAGWTALIHLTGGIRSPFLAGYGLEILLAARTFRSWGAGLMTLAVLAGLWGQEALYGIRGTSTRLFVQTGVFIGIGAVTTFLVRHWMREQKKSEFRASQVGARLQVLEGELEAMRELGTVGENVARVAHGLKNAVHALRGFSDLIARRMGEDEGSGAALAGLRTAIDQLEELTRTTLGGCCQGRGRGTGRPERGAVEASVRRVVQELSAAYPGVRVKCAARRPLPAVDLPGAALHEVLLELCRNAAEAMGGRGTLEVAADAQNGILRILVRDGGRGISDDESEHVFKPGYTTKPEGSGLGLFLARRLLQSHGGSLAFSRIEGGGTLFHVGIPVSGTAQAPEDSARGVQA